MVETGEESLENLQEVFQRIHTMKGEDNLDVLVTRFIQGDVLQLFPHISQTDLNSTNRDSLLCRFVEEDRNFAHYNFVNEQNNEAQALKDQISQVSFFLLLCCVSKRKRKSVIFIQWPLLRWEGMDETVSLRFLPCLASAYMLPCEDASRDRAV